MRILYDFQIFQLQEFGGISRYFTELIHLLSLDHKVDVGIKFSDNQYLKEKEIVTVKPLVDQRQEFLKGIEFYGKGRLFNYLKFIYPSKYYNCYHRNSEYSIELLKRQDFDIFHPTYYDDYFLEFIGDKPFVITIHDMTYEKFPEFFPVNDKTAIIKKQLAQKAAYIISVSEHTKKDIISFWGIREEKVTVIHHGLSSIGNNADINVDTPKDYLLFIGARDYYKNFWFFVQSCAEILIANNINLICTGKAFNAGEVQLFSDLKISNRVFHQFPNDSELSYLYKNAIALIFPSIYEGFGFPILEAFSNRCPVLLSKTSCFPEIAGDAALYFDPKSAMEIRTQIIQILFSKEIRERIVSEGERRLKSFSWTQAANQTVKIYNEACKG